MTFTGPRDGAPGPTPGGNQSETDRITQPRTVWLARWLWIAAAIVGFARSAIQLADRRAMIEQLREITPNLTQSEVDSAVNSGILLVLLFSLAVAGLYVLLANRMAGGRNWARIVVLVLAGFGVISTVLGFIGVGTTGTSVTVQGATVELDPLDMTFSAVVGLIQAVVLGCLLHSDSNRFFREHAAVRRRNRQVGKGG